MPEFHSKRAPSGMERWAVCEASIALCEGIPSTTSAAAERGTFVHDKCEKMLKGQLGANGFQKLDPDVQASVWLYFNTITDDQEPGDTLLVEQSVPSAYPNGGGTADAILWNPNTRHLTVYDFKNGTHPVRAEGNKQLLTYMLGAFLKYQFPALTMEIVIVQPNSSTLKRRVDRWEFDAMEILEFEAYYIERAQATESPLAKMVVGNHCFFCPAREAPGDQRCPAYLEKRREKAVASFAEYLDDPDPFG